MGVDVLFVAMLFFFFIVSILFRILMRAVGEQLISGRDSSGDEIVI